jgi:hypothetical protein
MAVKKPFTGININMNIYYTYAYLRTDGSPYYIGMGHGKRAWDKRHSVSLPPKERIQLIRENLTRQEAINLEKELISKYGRKDLDTGILHNRTSGGDGVSLPGKRNGMYGRKHSEETISKIKKARSKQIIRPRSDEHRKKMSELQKERGGYGPKKHTDQTIKKIREANTGKPGSKKLLGIAKSSEHKQKISEGRLNGKKHEQKTCPNCLKQCDPGNYARWHGTNCKFIIP